MGPDVVEYAIFLPSGLNVAFLRGVYPVCILCIHKPSSTFHIIYSPFICEDIILWPSLLNATDSIIVDGMFPFSNAESDTFHFFIHSPLYASQMRITFSSADTIFLPSGPKDAHRGILPSALSILMQAPEQLFHILIVLSCDVETILLLS